MAVNENLSMQLSYNIVLSAHVFFCHQHIELEMKQILLPGAFILPQFVFNYEKKLTTNTLPYAATLAPH
jgi:hypothetical protein